MEQIVLCWAKKNTQFPAGGNEVFWVEAAARENAGRRTGRHHVESSSLDVCENTSSGSEVIPQSVRATVSFWGQE